MRCHLDWEGPPNNRVSLSGQLAIQGLAIRNLVADFGKMFHVEHSKDLGAPSQRGRLDSASWPHLANYLWIFRKMFHVEQFPARPGAVGPIQPLSRPVIPFQIELSPLQVLGRCPQLWQIVPRGTISEFRGTDRPFRRSGLFPPRYSHLSACTTRAESAGSRLFYGSCTVFPPKSRGWRRYLVARGPPPF